MIHKGKSPWDQKPLLRNDKGLIALWVCRKPMDHLVRNADGDPLLFIHNGSGNLFCDLKHLHIRDGDYIILPRGTMCWRLPPLEEEPLKLLMVVASGGHFQLPEKGILGANAIFDQAILDVPSDQAFLAQ
ncbi:homogentisate 1,2-dioxygenase [uncultured Microbulbifer sp.]|uniref:homogentisate 1,2-dioxygenase n=1 Tax=uncultured Microbulbifer sp. TaxID=348147 RepID=UPI0026376D62|nr:homogentisate 1,2-dioxygenase [uncultured Microbulbifer sp.]